MRTKSVIFVVLFAITFVLASCRFGAERFSLGNLSDTSFPALDDSEAAEVGGGKVGAKVDSFVTEQLKPILDDTINLEIDKPVDTLDVVSEVDSLSPSPSPSPSSSIDTLSMDSLQRAIWRHNRAIDDSIHLDSLNRKRKNGIDHPVEYTANDSLVYVAGSKTAFLYGNSTVKYENMNLKSERIYMSLDSSLVHATGVLADTLNHVLDGTPVFQLGSDTYENDTMAFNFKTKKGLIQHVYTQQEDGFLHSEIAKRTAEGEVYLQHGRYTTCDADHPDFYIALSRAKVRPGKDVVFGPAYLVVADVPLPLAIPSLKLPVLQPGH